MARYGRDYGGTRGYDAGYGFGRGGGYREGNYGMGGYGGGEDRGYSGGGWGMEGLYRHVRYGEEYDQSTPTPYHSAADVRGQLGRGYDRGYSGGGQGRGYDRDQGSGAAWRQRGSGGRAGYDMAFGNWGDRSGLWGGGPRRLTGMESNRYRGVQGSGFRVGYGGDYAGGEGDHGGYRGTGWNRGGGMNPGRSRGYGY